MSTVVQPDADSSRDDDDGDGPLRRCLLEELVFRAYLISRMEAATTSALFAVCASAGLFAACHAYQGMRGVTEAFVFAVVSGFGFVLLRRIWPLVLAHIAWNLFMILRAAA